jgi:hypothetical protein
MQIIFSLRATRPAENPVRFVRDTVLGRGLESGLFHFSRETRLYFAPIAICSRTPPWVETELMPLDAFGLQTLKFWMEEVYGRG